MDKEDKEKKIWSSIKRSGVPLELQVYEILSARKDWNVNPSTYYVDPDENKGRELDVHATSEVTDYDNRASIRLNLIIQCKKVPGDAWVFFPVKGLHWVVPTSSVTEIAGHLRLAEIYKPFGSFLSQSDSTRTSRHYHEVVVIDAQSNKRDKKGRKADNLFEAVTSVTKATEYLRKKENDDMKNFVLDNADDIENEDSALLVACSMSIFQPVIVFDGMLYEATLESEESLKEVNHTRLVSEYRSVGHEIGGVPIDICTPSYLRQLLKEMEDKLRLAMELTHKKDDAGVSWTTTHKKRVRSAVGSLVSSTRQQS